VRKLSKLPDFPSSAATHKQYVDITIEGAKGTYDLLALFCDSDQSEECNIHDLVLTPIEKNLSEQLTRLFNLHGSDKSGTHNYPDLYAKLINLSNRNRFRLLEIGMGSNHLEVPSNMGAFGVPGASLRAWRDLSESIEVWGGDIDARILFSEERIETFEIDQMSQTSWEIFLKNLTNLDFDLIIDDGLHAPFANLMTIKNLISKLTDGGVLVVEDINSSALSVWRIFEKMLSKDHSFRLIKAKSSYVVLIKKNGQFGF
jgi:hypothetical protein